MSNDSFSIEKTWIAPSGMKSWSVFKKLNNGIVAKVGTYRSMRRAAEVELSLNTPSHEPLK